MVLNDSMAAEYEPICGITFAKTITRKATATMPAMTDLRRSRVSAGAEPALVTSLPDGAFAGG
ncbi:unannotated protein [freshwater metagenome]|uniref:Unannotated protein n=1 Tax=freshwater metagenome TaxID=449393 RepID=A0A6J7R957_9ZZZZ